MITPVKDRVLGNSRACFTCVISSVLIPVYNCIFAASGLLRGFKRGMIPLNNLGRECARVQGLRPCCLSGMRTKGGSCGGRFIPPQVTTIERSLGEAECSPYRVRMHATCARIAHALGHSTYLMITVPIDTILRINNLQLFCQKMLCHFVLFLQKGLDHVYCLSNEV